MATPDYQLRYRMQFDEGQHDHRVLEAGTFVRPVEYQYVPKHVKDKPVRLYVGSEMNSYYERQRGYDKARDVFCYCRHRFVLVEREALVRV